jgi:hypothetical protein
MCLDGYFIISVAAMNMTLSAILLNPAVSFRDAPIWVSRSARLWIYMPQKLCAEISSTVVSVMESCCIMAPSAFSVATCSTSHHILIGAASCLYTLWMKCSQNRRTGNILETGFSEVKGTDSGIITRTDRAVLWIVCSHETILKWTQPVFITSDFYCLYKCYANLRKT